MKLAEAIIINSEKPAKSGRALLRGRSAEAGLIYEALDQELFRPGDHSGARAAMARIGVSRPSCCSFHRSGRTRTVTACSKVTRFARPQLKGRQLATVGPQRDVRYAEALRTLTVTLGYRGYVAFVRGVPLEETAFFYRADAVFVYPSFNETFGLPILEAMTRRCPVVTSNVSAMPENATGAAELTDPHDPESIALGDPASGGPESGRPRERGLRRAAEFTWGATAEATLNVYRDVARRRASR